MDGNLTNVVEIDRSEIAQSFQCDMEDLPKLFQIKKQDFTLISQNIRSIYNNIYDLQVTLSNLNIIPDVIVLTECWLNPTKPVPNLQEYDSFATTQHLNQNDGVVIYVHKSLIATAKEITISHASCMQIELDNNIILGIYRSPSNPSADNFNDSLNNHLVNLKTCKNLILTGDININIIPKITEPSYERNNRSNYLNMLSTHGLIPGHILPTREINCLDHIFLKINKHEVSANVAVLNTTITDHSLVLLNINTSKSKILAPKTKTLTNYDNALNTLVEKNICQLLCSTDPHFVINQLIKKITETLKENTKTVRIPKNNRIIKPWITPGILRCIKNRNKMQKKLKVNPHDNILKISYKRYRNYCNNLIKKLKHKFERNQLVASSKNSKELWKNIKNITYSTTAKTDNRALLKLKSSPIDSVNDVNNYFVNIGKTLAEQISSASLLNKHDNLVAPNFQLSSFVLLNTSAHEVNSIISRLKTNSATGWDNITTRFLKLARHEVTPIICHFTNLCFENGTFPSQLKQAIVTPIHKGGDRGDVNNYRPISVLPAISKIVEKCLNSRLIGYINKYNLISKLQFGFRQGKSTEDATTNLSSLIVEHLDQNKKCMCVFLDLKKAFDTVSVPILVDKLEKVGIRGTPLKLFSDYLSDRKQSVKIGEYISAETNTSYGVPQGSVLGPTLFLVYINELCNLSLNNGQVFCYADDTAIVFSGNSWNEVQRSAEEGLAKIAAWLNSNLLTLNINKTNYICFSIRNSTQPNNDFNIKIHTCGDIDKQNCSCSNINKVKSTKYLGVILDEKLSWYPQIELVANRVRKLTWIFKKLRHVAPLDLLNKIYIALGQSIISYCIPVWGGAARTRFIEVERAQRYLLKVMHFKPYRFSTDMLYSVSKVLTVRQLYIINIILKLHKTLRFDPNILKKRTNNNVVPTVINRTAFAGNQFRKQSCYLYNKINKFLNIYSMNFHDCKKTLNNWLKDLSFDDTEAFLQIIR